MSPKPQWLKDVEKDRLIKRNMCSDCVHFGEFVRMSKHNGKEPVEVHECAIHPGCMNTRYSLGCSDFSR